MNTCGLGTFLRVCHVTMYSLQFYFSAAINTMTESSVRRFISAGHPQVTLCHWGLEQALKQGRNLKVETDAEAREACCWLAWSPRLAQPAVLFKSGCGTQVWHHPPSDGPSHVKKTQHRLVPCPICWSHFSIEVPISKITPARSSWHKTSQHRL